jgi:hypothetical protein
MGFEKNSTVKFRINRRTPIHQKICYYIIPGNKIDFDVFEIQFPRLIFSAFVWRTSQCLDSPRHETFQKKKFGFREKIKRQGNKNENKLP